MSRTRPSPIASFLLALLCLLIAAASASSARNTWAEAEAQLDRQRDAVSQWYEEERQRRQSDVESLQLYVAALAAWREATHASKLGAERTRNRLDDARSAESSRAASLDASFTERLREVRRDLDGVTFDRQGRLIGTKGGFMETLCGAMRDTPLEEVTSDYCGKALRAERDLRDLYSRATQARDRARELTQQIDRTLETIDDLERQLLDTTQRERRVERKLEHAQAHLNALQAELEAKSEAIERTSRDTLWSGWGLVWWLHELLTGALAIIGAGVCLLRGAWLAGWFSAALRLPDDREANP